MNKQVAIILALVLLLVIAVLGSASDGFDSYLPVIGRPRDNRVLGTPVFYEPTSEPTLQPTYTPEAPPYD